MAFHRAHHLHLRQRSDVHQERQPREAAKASLCLTILYRPLLTAQPGG